MYNYVPGTDSIMYLARIEEYCCSFEDTAGAVFAYNDIAEAITGDVEPLWVPGVDARADDDDEPASLWSKGGEVENR